MKRVIKHTLSKQGGQDQLVWETIALYHKVISPQEGYSQESAPGGDRNTLRNRAKERQGHAKQVCLKTTKEYGAEPLAKTIR